jgi:hypothetical protein
MPRQLHSAEFAYDSQRLSNFGIGHGAVDAGGGFTYFDPQTGHEFSAVLGFTYVLRNQSIFGVGIGYVFPIGNLQGYLNLKGFKELTPGIGLKVSTCGSPSRFHLLQPRQSRHRPTLRGSVGIQLLWVSGGPIAALDPQPERPR